MMNEPMKNGGGWSKVGGKKQVGLYRYDPSGQYFARIRSRGRLVRRKLGTTDFAFAKRKLFDLRRDLERTDATRGNMSFGAMLDEYSATLKGAESTKEDKRKIIARLKDRNPKDGLFGCCTLPAHMIKPSQIEAWLVKHFGGKSASYYNSALAVIRAALDMAVRDRIISENPAAHIEYEKRKKPIRLTPTFEQFKAIVADIRSQPFSPDAEQSADFVEFLGLAGLGQAEAASIIRAHVRLEAGQIDIYRHKTSAEFVIPIYPQARALVERLCEGKAHNARLFTMASAHRALTAACRRLGLPHFTHRSLRRMFITRAIEKGADVKVLAQWQGHKDGGRLILQTYSHVRPEHSNRMAQLMTDEEPENVIPLQSATGN